MKEKKTGLGRGLSELGLTTLLGAPHTQDAQEGGDSSAPPLSAFCSQVTGLQEVGVDQLVPGRYQPRQSMDVNALDALAQSLQSEGMIQPIIVRVEKETASQGGGGRNGLRLLRAIGVGRQQRK